MEIFHFESPRFKFRNFKREDGQWLFKLNSDPTVLKYTGDQPFDSIEDAERFVSNYDQYQKYGFGRWAVIDKSTQEAVGWSGLKNNGSGKVDLGFRFFAKHWNKGFATECAQACLAYGFKSFGLEGIVGRCSMNHEASAKVLRKIGMEKIGEDFDAGIGPIIIFEKRSELSNG